MSPSLHHDLLLDRRRLKRRLLAWRVAAVVLAGVAGFVALRPQLEAMVPRDHLVRLRVEGAITDDPRVARALEAAALDRTVRGLILSIDSSGGTVSGGEALHAAVAGFRASGKPVAAVMRGTAASAAYMAAMPAGRVFARESTVTGSIGVLLQSFDASELLGRLGVRPEALTSGALKAQPSPFQPLTPEGRAALQAVVADLHAQFVAMVAAGRRMSVEQVQPLADGRVYTGRQALALGLVDAIGGEPEARAWMEAQGQVPVATPVRELDPRGTSERWLGFALRGLGQGLATEWLAIDGIRAVWQP